MKQRWMGLILFLVLLLAGCGASKEAYQEKPVDSKGMAVEDRETTEDLEMEKKSADSESDSGQTTIPSSISQNRKLILIYRYDIETLDFNQSYQSMLKLVTKAGGYIERSETHGNRLDRKKKGQIYGQYTLRIPTATREAFISDIQDLGSVMSENLETQDVTAEYIDVSARIKTLKLQEERLLAILKEASELEYLIELERELADVRYEIERYESTRRSLDNKVDFTTIHIYIEEVQQVTEAKPVTLGQRISHTFQISLRGLGRFFETILILFVGFSPILIVLGIGIGLFILLIRAIGRRSRQKHERMESERQARLAEMRRQQGLNQGLKQEMNQEMHQEVPPEQGPIKKETKD